MILAFDRPTYLLLLVFVPLIILVHFITLRKKRTNALMFANFEAIAKIKGVDLLSKNIFVLIATILVLFCLVFSLAGAKVIRSTYSSSSSFVIAIDTSESMEATDFSPTRFEGAKKAALSFVDLTPPGTKIGIISFSGNSFIEQIPSEEKSKVKSAIKNIPLSEIGGTDIGEAIITSSNILASEPAKSLIIISDGRINVGNIQEAIDYAIEKEVIIHSIAIGSEEGGETSYGLSKVDQDSLKAIAYNTEGVFYLVQDQEELEQAFFSIIDLKLKNVSTDLSAELLVVAILLFVIEYVLVNTKYRIIP